MGESSRNGSCQLETAAAKHFLQQNKHRCLFNHPSRSRESWRPWLQPQRKVPSSSSSKATPATSKADTLRPQSPILRHNPSSFHSLLFLLYRLIASFLTSIFKIILGFSFLPMMVRSLTLILVGVVVFVNLRDGAGYIICKGSFLIHHFSC